MAQKAPGKHFREGISLMELFQMYSDNETAMQWFVEARWPDGIRCVYCESENIKVGAKHRSMPYRCNDCKKTFHQSQTRSCTALTYPTRSGLLQFTLLRPT